jgi:hypothetical protein
VVIKITNPAHIGFANGVEYKKVLEELANNYGINTNNSTSFNHQSNGIINELHLG